MEIRGSLIQEVMNINCSLPYFNAGRKYQLSRFNLVRAGYPAEIQNDQRLQRLNKSPRIPIVVEKNRGKYGSVPALQYFAPAIVIAGAARRAKLLAEGNTRAWGWVEKGALPITTDDAMTSQELLEQLQTLLVLKHTKPGHSITSLNYPWIIAFYPFENAVIYQMEGTKFRHGYNLSPDSRIVRLAGTAIEVADQFLIATAQRDLMRQTCSFWSVPHEAATMFLSDCKAGLFRTLKCSSYLPECDLEESIFKVLDEKLIGYMDFVRWSLQEQADTSYKMISGKKIPSTKFRTPDKNDKSTWLLKVK